MIAPVTNTATGRMLEAYMSRGLVVFTGIFPDSEDAADAIPTGAVGHNGPVGGGFLLAGIIINGTDTGLSEAEIVNHMLSATGPDDITVFINEIGNVPPVLSEIGVYSINAQDTLTFRVSATDFVNDAISYRLSGAPPGAAISGQGIFRWTPESLDTGIHTFAVTAYDGHGYADTEFVTVRVMSAGAGNTPPTTTNVTATVDRGDTVIIVPAISDPDGDRFGIIGAISGAGDTMIPSDDRIEYITALGSTTETITYIVGDSRGAMSTGTVTVTVTARDGQESSPATIIIAVADRPDPSPVVSSMRVQTIAESNSVTFNVASDSAGSYAWGIREKSRTSFDSIGSFSLTGPDYVFGHTETGLKLNTSYVLVVTSSNSRLEDGSGTALDFMTVGTPGSPPTLIRDPISIRGINEDAYSSSGFNFYLSGAGSDPDGDRLVVTNFTQPSHGRVERLTDDSAQYYDYNTLTYYPNIHYHGQDSFTYSISDGHHPPVTGTVSITIRSVNDRPQLPNFGTFEYEINDLIKFQIDAFDPDDPVLQYSIRGTRENPLPRGATVTDTGLFTWTPTAAQAGMHVIELRVSDGEYTTTQDLVFNIDDNRDPVIEPIANIIATVGTPLTFTINATDADDDPLEFSLDDWLIGMRIDPYTGTFTWTPNIYQRSTYGFLVAVSDGQGGRDAKWIPVIVTSTAANTLELAEIHDKTFFIGNNDEGFTAFLTSAPSEYPVLFSLSDAPIGATIHNSSGGFNWQPSTNQTGPHTFTVNVQAGSQSDSEEVTITVNELPDPVADLTIWPSGIRFVLEPDKVETYAWSVKTKDSITVESGSIHVQNHHLNQSFQRWVYFLMPDTEYFLQIVLGSDDAIRIDFRTDIPPGIPPVAVDDHVNVTEDRRISIDVRANDMDPDGILVVVEGQTQPSHGSVRFSPTSHALIYTPNPNYHGPDSFTYTITDGFHAVTGTVNITVTPVNDAPIIRGIRNHDYGVGQSIAIPIPASDVDDPVESLTYTLKGDPDIPDGAMINSSGVFTWIPTADQIGRHYIEMTASDGISNTSYRHRFDISESYIEFDKDVYTWTDRVHIAIVAPSHNYNDSMVETIGLSAGSSVRIRSFDDLRYYRLVETGNDTGVFAGVVTLTGFHDHDADDDGQIGDAPGDTGGIGPTNGRLETYPPYYDYLKVEFESFNENLDTFVPISWNIGKVEWGKPSYLITDSGMVRVIDPDMNLNPDEIDSFEVDVSSVSDTAGINLPVTETGINTGIFEGTVYFVINDSSRGQRLHVTLGDTLTAEYDDSTLPSHNRSGELEVSATATVVSGVRIVPIGNMTVDVQDTISFQINTVVINNDTVNFHPYGGNLEGPHITSDGVFSWTPTAEQVGNHTIYVSAYNNRLGFDGERFTITVNAINATG